MGKDIVVMQNEEKIRPKKSEVETLQCDNRKIKSIGWYAKTNLVEGLKETIGWFKDNKDFYKFESNFI